MKKLDDIDKITDEINIEIKKTKKDKKMKLSEKTIKVTSVINAIVILVAMIAMFFTGWLSNTAYNNARQAEIKTEATALVKDLKIEE